MDEKRGHFLTELRKKENLTQEELAKLINYSAKNISKWESGKSYPVNPDTILKLSEIFKVSPDELISGSYKKKENEKEIKNSFLLYINNNYKKTHFIILSLIILLIILFTCLITCFYFAFVKNSVKYYKISGQSEKGYYFNSSLFISNKISILNFNKIDNDKIKSITIYYEENNKKILVFRGENDNYILQERNNNINYNLEKLYKKDVYIEIGYEDSDEIIKLEFEEIYTNDNIFPKKVKDGYITEYKKPNEKINEILLEEGFEYFKESNDYRKRIGDNILYLYTPDRSFDMYISEGQLYYTLLSYINDNQVLYDVTNEFGILEYENIDLNDKIKCKKINCDSLNIHLEYLRNLIYKIRKVNNSTKK